MATFSSLAIDPATMLEGNKDSLEIDGNELDDNQLKELNKKTSKSEILLDLRNDLNLIDNTTDNEIIDSITDKYYDRLQRALMFKQLFYWYFTNNNGEGTKTYDRMIYYRNAYDMERAYFPNFKLDNIEIINSSIINTKRS